MRRCVGRSFNDSSALLPPFFRMAESIIEERCGPVSDGVANDPRSSCLRTFSIPAGADGKSIARGIPPAILNGTPHRTLYGTLYNWDLAWDSFKDP